MRIEKLNIRRSPRRGGSGKTTRTNDDSTSSEAGAGSHRAVYGQPLSWTDADRDPEEEP